MAAPKFTVRWYATGRGAEPVREWLRSLDPAARKEIGADLLNVQNNWPIGMPSVRPLGDGLYELRSTAESGEYRVFFCIVDKMIVALHGFQKKTKKTPQAELDAARWRQKDFTR